MPRSTKVRDDEVLDPYVPERGDGRYAVTHYDLDLVYRVSSNRLSGRATLDVSYLEETDRIAVDLAGLRASKVAVDGRGRPWAHRGDRIMVRLPDTAVVGDTTTVTITYAGNPGRRGVDGARSAGRSSTTELSSPRSPRGGHVVPVQRPPQRQGHLPHRHRL